MDNCRYIVLSAGQEWNLYSWESTTNNPNIEFINELFAPIILKKFWWRKICRNPIFCKLFWFPYVIYRLGINDNRKTVLIIYDWHYLTKSPYIFNLLNKKYINLTTVYCFTNLSKVTGAKTFGILSSLKNTYDQVYAFDKLDSEKFGFKYSKLIYAPIRENIITNVKPEYDLFYIGQAKDRLQHLIEIFRHAKNEGLRCKFFITEVPREQQYADPDITYNQNLSYKEVLMYISKSKGIVDAIQGDSTGMTIKTCEAVFWNKKLITTNIQVKDEPYYKVNNILIYNNQISLKEFMNLNFIPYTDKDRYEFSPYRLFKQIEKN